MPILKKHLECNGKCKNLKNPEQEKTSNLMEKLAASQTDLTICKKVTYRTLSEATGKKLLENGIEPLCTNF